MLNNKQIRYRLFASLLGSLVVGLIFAAIQIWILNEHIESLREGFRFFVILFIVALESFGVGRKSIIRFVLDGILFSILMLFISQLYFIFWPEIYTLDNPFNNMGLYFLKITVELISVIALSFPSYWLTLKILPVSEEEKSCTLSSEG